MRTTLRLDDDLLAEVKQVAARSDRILTAVSEDGLREVLARQRKAEERRPVRLLTVLRGGRQPGVDLDDSAALLSLMEEFNDPA
jgi:hypothetical protein